MGHLCYEALLIAEVQGLFLGIFFQNDILLMNKVTQVNADYHHVHWLECFHAN